MATTKITERYIVASVQETITEYSTYATNFVSITILPVWSGTMLELRGDGNDLAEALNDLADKVIDNSTALNEKFLHDTLDRHW